jgi:solute carrier family 35 protein F5
LRIAHKHGWRKIGSSAVSYWQGQFEGYQGLKSKAREENNGHEVNPSEESSDTRLLVDDDIETIQLSRIPMNASKDPNAVLSVRETTWLSLEFCLLWFAAKYFVTACLEYTSVASFTILTSTSSIWTLLLGAIFGVEQFSVKKFIGVLASLTGIMLISSVDLAGDNDDNRGKFPHKSQREVAIGDAMAFISAVLYGMYAIIMKSRIDNEDRVNMPLFFGMTGLLNLIFLWPGFLILHCTGVEKFELPLTGKIWTIVLV